MKQRILSAFIVIFILLSFGTVSISAYNPGVDVSELEALVAEAKGYKQENYDVSALTWNVFLKVLEYSESLLDPSISATQADVDLAVQDLRERIEKLGPSNYVEPDIPATESVNKSELELLIVEAKSWKKTEYDVANWEWSNFLAEIEMANAVFESDGSTQSEVDYAMRNLSNAMNEMRSKKNTNQTPDFETTPIETMPSIQTERPSETVYIPQTEKPKETNSVLPLRSIKNERYGP